MRIKITKYLIFSFTLLIAFNSISLSGQNNHSDSLDIHSDTLAARQILNKKDQLIEKGDYEAALKALQSAKALYSKHNLWEAAIQSAIQSSELAESLNSNALKLEKANEAIYLARKYLPADHLLLASALRLKSECMTWLRFVDSANLCLVEAIPIFKKNEKWIDVGWSEIILGYNYLGQNKLDACEYHFDIIQDLIREKKFSKQDEIAIRTSLAGFKGVLYEKKGDYTLAIHNLQNALALRLEKSKRSNSDNYYILEYYKHLGAMYYEKGDYQRALDHSLKAGFRDENDPVLFNNIGNIYISKREFNKAIEYFQKSKTLTFGQENRLGILMNTLNGLAICYRELKDYDTAIGYCNQAIGLPTDLEKYRSWSILGNLYLKQNWPEPAIEHFNQAVRAYGRDSTTLLKNSFFISILYRLTGDAYFLNNDQNTALKYYQKALVVNHAYFKDSLNFNANPSLTGIYDPIYFLEAIRAKAKAQSSFEQTSHQEAALTSYQLAIQWIDTMQASYVIESSQLDWSGEFKPIYEEAIQVADRLFQNTKATKYLNLAFSFSEKSKNAILLEALKATEGKSYAGVPDSLIQKEKDLNLDIAFYEKALRKTKEPEKEKPYQQYLSTARLKLSALKEQLEKDFPKFYELKYGGETTSIAIVQAKLVNEESALLEYFVGDSSAFVFVITKQSADLLQFTSPAQLKKNASEFRKELLNYDVFQQNVKTAFADYKEKAFTLYQYIVEPALKTLSVVNQLIIVPDGVLNTFPFEALVTVSETPADFDFTKLAYLFYNYQISYAYSADLLLKNQERQYQLPANTKCFALAPEYLENNQILSLIAGRDLSRNSGKLEGTANEIQQIAEYFKGRFEIGETATERQFKTQADQFGILHLAMHGRADLENANFNHLAFSNFNRDSLEDDLLYHYEIANMKLKAQLAVLSACETGAGRYEEGEGVYSLARSFMYAGVPSVVMSLWKVSDEATSKLMPYFYENLAEGQPKATALHNAKLRFLEEANLEFRHPFFWSAFVLLGDTQALKKEPNHLVWWSLGVLIVLLSIWWMIKKK